MPCPRFALRIPSLAPISARFDRNLEKSCVYGLSKHCTMSALQGSDQVETSRKGRPTLQVYNHVYIPSTCRTALMEERSSSVSEDSASQAEDEDSRDTVAPDAANVPDIHHGQSELGACHPTLGNFILSNKKVQHGRDQQYMQWVAGRQPKDKRKKYKDADKRILKILQEYQRNERTVIELLRGIAQNIVIDDVVGIEDVIENDE
ncbi:hypothetical protein DdX_15593 [Ditylenchus destructor]|uniref:Uncharacterized protein n=1 Tax=Ditylenchus destructor TaxID=166010 RepID=A0AAD4R0R3_9BILA|nr:hypothetical protein DdX_15593 [Ditylenchus destructor]